MSRAHEDRVDSQPVTQVLEHDDDVPLGIGGQTKIQLEPDDYDRLLTAAARDAQREAAERESGEDEADAAFRRSAPESSQLTDSPDGEPLKQFAANLSRDRAATAEAVDDRADEDPFEAFSRLPRRATAPVATQTGSAALTPTTGSRRHVRRPTFRGQRRGRLRFRSRSVIAALSVILVLAITVVLLDHGHQAPAARQAASSPVASVHPLSDPLIAAREKLTPSVDARIQQRRASATAARARRAQHARAAAAAAARARQRRLEQRRTTSRTHHRAATSRAPNNTANPSTTPQTQPAPAQRSTPTSTPTTTSASSAGGSRGTTTSSSHRPLYGADGSAGLGHAG